MTKLSTGEASSPLSPKNAMGDSDSTLLTRPRETVTSKQSENRVEGSMVLAVEPSTPQRHTTTNSLDYHKFGMLTVQQTFESAPKNHMYESCVPLAPSFDNPQG